MNCIHEHCETCEVARLTACVIANDQRIASLLSACGVAKEALDKCEAAITLIFKQAASTGWDSFEVTGRRADDLEEAQLAARNAIYVMGKATPEQHSSREPSPNGERVALLEAVADGARYLLESYTWLRTSCGRGPSLPEEELILRLAALDALEKEQGR